MKTNTDANRRMNKRFYTVIVGILSFVFILSAFKTKAEENNKKVILPATITGDTGSGFNGGTCPAPYTDVNNIDIVNAFIGENREFLFVAIPSGRYITFSFPGKTNTLINGTLVVETTGADNAAGQVSALLADNTEQVLGSIRETKATQKTTFALDQNCISNLKAIKIKGTNNAGRYPGADVVSVYIEYENTKPRIYGLSVGGFNTKADRKAFMSAKDDARQLRNIFIKNKLKGYKNNCNDFRIFTPEKAPTMAQLDGWIQKAYKNATEADLCYFIYSGHGTCAIDGYTPIYSKEDPEKAIGCKVKYSGAGITLRATKSGQPDYYPYQELIDTLDYYCKGHIIMIVGTCYSGGFATAAKGNPKFTVITGCSSKETLGGTIGNYSLRDPDDQKRFDKIAQTIALTIFGKAAGVDVSYNDLTYFINKGLSGSHKMDANKDRKVTVKEFYQYLKKNMNKKRGVNPKYYAANPKQVIFQY